MAAVSVTTSATLVYTALGNAGMRDQVIITNDSGNSVYVGTNDAVTTSTGVHLPTGGTLGLELVAGRTVYAIAGSTSEVRVEGWV